jgi:hypothetical protein
MPINGYGGGHGGDEICRANGFLGVEMALVLGVFSSPCLLNYAVNYALEV